MSDDYKPPVHKPGSRKKKKVRRKFVIPVVLRFCKHCKHEISYNPWYGWTHTSGGRYVCAGTKVLAVAEPWPYTPKATDDHVAGARVDRATGRRTAEDRGPKSADEHSRPRSKSRS